MDCILKPEKTGGSTYWEEAGGIPDPRIIVPICHVYPKNTRMRNCQKEGGFILAKSGEFRSLSVWPKSSN